MRVRKCHVYHPLSHHHLARWYVYHSQSFSMVYDVVLPTVIQCTERSQLNHHTMVPPGDVSWFTNPMRQFVILCGAPKR